MLQEITIDNLAIIDHLTLDFGQNMTVLTGETGAGKSIIIDAVGLLAGARGSQELIRQGTDKLEVQGQFLIPNDPSYIDLLDHLGIDHAERTLIISREIRRNGRNTIRANGTLINTTLLRQIGAPLVDIQGQNDNQRLLQSDQHLPMLDYFAGAKVQQLLVQYQKSYQQYRNLKKKLETKQANEQQWAQRLDMLRYQVNEIKAANLKADEEDSLINERDRLDHFQQIQNTLKQVVAILNGGETTPVLDQLATAMDAVNEITQFDDNYEGIGKTLEDSYYSLQDVANQASHELDGLEFDEERLSEINTRLDLINDLERKYGDTVTDVLNYYAKITQELTDMEGTVDSDDEMKHQLSMVVNQLSVIGEQLSEERKKAAKKLEKKVHQELSALYMEKAVFTVHFGKTPAHTFTATGIDNAEFYIQTNPGERMGPLAKIASGGELSRVMLALKTIFAEQADITSIIFDEVDTGVSGRVAQAIADKIKVIADHSQVLCITHLPQVAAVAQHQFLIKKQIHEKRTTTTVTELNHQERVAELSRMLAGEKITKLTREHASELLKMAHE
ncbi:DNA repair protein RecN [uncultured Limosilactobacillus sp.]|uniref:DNA repair protein RecN n=1 Tax=uncultured Limosilactobacillus sp. TaxID=2837629 RepID=UPI0025E6BFE0|nr:DNA repair protein RecN [uncultured Limosilactobacillus sp.]